MYSFVPEYFSAYLPPVFRNVKRSYAAMKVSISRFTCPYIEYIGTFTGYAPPVTTLLNAISSHAESEFLPPFMNCSTALLITGSAIISQPETDMARKFMFVLIALKSLQK